MIRAHLFNKLAPSDPLFRWRGGEISRIEGLSDGVFSVTLTLIVVSLNVPETFYELWLVIKNLPIFLVCFIVLMMAWRYHYIFFRRYGLEDFQTSLMNGAFLFLILFYAYPLKFLVTFLWKLILREDVMPMFAVPFGIEWGAGMFFQRSGMMYFFGLGVAGVFGVLALMVFRAYRLRDKLELDELECFLTQSSIRSHLITSGVALLSLAVLLIGGQPGYSGVIYFLLLPLHVFERSHKTFRIKKIKEKSDEKI